MKIRYILNVILALLIIVFSVTILLPDFPAAETVEGRIAIIILIIIGGIILISTLLISALHEVRKRTVPSSKSGFNPAKGNMTISGVSFKCPNCGCDVLEEYVACPYCGLALKVMCSSCREYLKREFIACPFCGHHLETPQAPGSSAAGAPVYEARQIEIRKKEMSAQQRKYKLWVAAVAIILIFVCSAVLLNKIIRSASDAAKPDELWEEANTALFKFIGEGMNTFGQDEANPATYEEVELLSKYLGKFNEAVEKLSKITPPTEQVIIHQAVLPIYENRSQRNI